MSLDLFPFYHESGVKKLGRDAATSSGNVWREARLRAAKWNDELNSQDGVADLIGCGRDAIRRIENGLNKVMPVDTAILLADLYRAPELKNYYCIHECPIGRNHPLSEDAIEIERATVRLTQILRKETVQEFKHTLQDIAMDGVISDDELDDFCEIVDGLKDVARVISELEVIRDKRMAERLGE